MFLCAVCTSTHSRYVDVVNSLTLIITHFLHNFQTLKKKKNYICDSIPVAQKLFYLLSSITDVFFNDKSQSHRQ